MISLTATAASEEVLRKLQNAGPVFERAATAYLNKSASMVVGSARDFAPRARGILAGSITAGSVKKQMGQLSVTVGSNVKYAPYQEMGTGIYGKYNRPITPKRAKILAWKSGGGWVFAKSVKGVRPKKYLEKGVKKMQDNQHIAFSEADKIIRGSL